MAQLIAIALAARQLGISRHDVQKLVLNGDLESYNGAVDFDELSCRFPQLRLQDSLANERVKLIKATAFGRRVGQAVAPDTDELETRLHKRETDLAINRARAQHYQKLFKEFLGHLGSLQDDATAEQKALISELNRWIMERME
ncbi:MAG: hypothetical protein OQK78_04695 [Gammaproteobacteria bacterium]|nr:hypothetical protein [Gammaproteobacteria bacterium]